MLFNKKEKTRLKVAYRILVHLHNSEPHSSIKIQVFDTEAFLLLVL